MRSFNCQAWLARHLQPSVSFLLSRRSITGSQCRAELSIGTHASRQEMPAARPGTVTGMVCVVVVVSFCDETERVFTADPCLCRAGFGGRALMPACLLHA